MSIRRVESLRNRVQALQQEIELEEKRDKPEIALRRTSDGELDDTVVNGVESVHFELMSDDVLWLGVFLENGDRICFSVHAEMADKATATLHGKGRGKRVPVLKYDATELPEYGYDDWDEVHGSKAS